MRRDQFLKSMAALMAAGSLPNSAWQPRTSRSCCRPIRAAAGTRQVARWARPCRTPAWQALVSYENKGGAAGAIGLAQFYNANKGDPNALMVMGAVMLGGIITGKPPVSVTQLTPIAP